jgi:hypothetical protein
MMAYSLLQPPGPEPPSFVLAPLNRNAERVTSDPSNQYLRTALPNGTWGIYVSFANPDKQEFTLGRGDRPDYRNPRGGVDIYLGDPKGGDISKIQCSFVNNDIGAVRLVDRSSRNNTETLPSRHSSTISLGKDRSVLVAKGINEQIALGRDKYYQFEIQWGNSDGLYDFPNKQDSYQLEPRNKKSKEKRYIQGEMIGGGTYGTVWWALDVHTGKVMAVKKFHNLQDKNLDFAKREVENLKTINKKSSISHVSRGIPSCKCHVALTRANSPRLEPYNRDSRLYRRTK